MYNVLTASYMIIICFWSDFVLIGNIGNKKQNKLVVLFLIYGFNGEKHALYKVFFLNKTKIFGVHLTTKYYFSLSV